MKLTELNIEILREAIKIYLKTAYPNNGYENRPIAEEINYILNENDLDSVLKKFDKNFDKFLLRFGSIKYPFLKMGFMKTPITEHYGFFVDMHSEFFGQNPDSQSYQREVEMKKIIREYKDKIESEWEEAKIPTYKFYVKKYSEICKEQEKAKEKETHEITKSSKKILIAEDEIEIRKMYELQLKMMGFDFTSVDNGEEVIKQLENNSFDLLILDLMMPKLSGFEVIKRVKDKVKIMVLSALDDENTREKCISDGASAYFSKPIKFNEFKKSLEEL